MSNKICSFRVSIFTSFLNPFFEKNIENQGCLIVVVENLRLFSTKMSKALCVGRGEGCVVVLCAVFVFYVLEMPSVLSHSQGFLDYKRCTCILCFLIACKNYMSAVCGFNSLCTLH